jgi:hypothetical protein
MVAKGALFTYLGSRMAQDARAAADPLLNNLVSGLTSKNYAAKRPALVNAVQRAMQGRLAQDADIKDLANLLDALAPAVENADQAPGLGQIATNPGGGAATAPAAGPDAGEDIIAQIKQYLEQEGVAPEIINNLDAFAAEHNPATPGVGDNGDRELAGRGDGEGMVGDDAEELTEGGPNGPAMGVMEPRGGASTPHPTAEGDAADQGIVPETQTEQQEGVATVSSEGVSSRVVNGGGAQDRRLVTRAALDKAIKIAADNAIRNQRAIREAERFVRPWVGDMAMDSAAGPADVYRAALKALGVNGADKVHPDALRPILEAQPRPSARMARDRQITLAQDAGGGVEGGSFLDRFPDAKRITVQ